MAPDSVWVPVVAGAPVAAFIERRLFKRWLRRFFRDTPFVFITAQHYRVDSPGPPKVLTRLELLEMLK